VPNILLETTSNLPDSVEFPKLFAAIHHVLHETAGIRLDNCKSRVTKFDQFYIGDGHPSNAFVQLSIRFVEGRSSEIKIDVGNQCLALLKQFYHQSVARLDLQVTVEIGDIHLEEYFKYPEGTFTPQ